MTIELANRLCAYRKHHGLSQEELAEKLEISRQAVSCWERAETSPDTDNLILLSKIYSVTLDELLYQDPQAVPPREAAPQQFSRRKRKTYNWYDFPFTLICIAVYITLGVLFTPGGWGWGLLVFLLVGKVLLLQRLIILKILVLLMLKELLTFYGHFQL